MESFNIKDGKTIAIISYLTVIGTVIALILNNSKKNSFASFHIRQAIGLYLLLFVINLLIRYNSLGWLGNLLSLGAFVLVIMGLIGAIQGEEKRIPYLGNQFQEWFKNIG